MGRGALSFGGVLVAAVLVAGCGGTAATSASPSSTSDPLGPTVASVSRPTTGPAAGSATAGSAAGAVETSSSSAPDAGTSALTVPITTTNDADGLPRVIVQISVGGGAAVPVILDTGSSGLMIDASAVGPDVDTTGSVPYTKNYVDSSISGSVVQAPVTIDGVSTPPIGVVSYQDSVAATKMTGGIAKGLMGIASEGQAGTAPAIWSPSLQLPAPYDTMSTLAVAASGAGTWTLGPVTAPAAAVTVPLTAVDGAPDNAGRWGKDMSLCWTFPGLSAVCGDTDLDTGAQNMLVNSDVKGVSDAADQPVTIAATAGGSPLWSITTGQPLTGVHLASLGTTQFNTGLSFFYDHLVTYDYAQGQVSISPR